MKRIAIIDGDELAFRVAAACETRSILAVNKDDPMWTYECKHRTEFKELLVSDESVVTEVFSDFIITDIQKTEPLEFALNTIKQSINNILKACNASSYEIYLSGKDNFRDKIPLIKQYKSNRKDSLKPLLLKDVRKYLEKHHKAKVIDNYEVDDKLIMRCTEGNTSGDVHIACTQDKDARGCDIHLYNPVKDKLEKISGIGSLYLNDKDEVKGEGAKWLYFQWVFGDPTDYYKPCEVSKTKFGEKSAYKLLKDCNTHTECIQVVYDQYKKWYPDRVKYEAWNGEDVDTDAVGMMQMYFDCAHMLRWENDFINVKEVLSKLNIAH